MERDLLFGVAALCLVGLTIVAFNMAGQRDSGSAEPTARDARMQLSPEDAGLRVLTSPPSDEISRTTASSPSGGSQNPASGMEGAGPSLQVVVTVAAPTGPSLIAAGAIQEGDVVLVDDAGEYRHDSGDLRRGSVTLRFDKGATAGWLSLRRDAITFEDSDVRAFFSPDQPNYQRGVFEDRPGIRVQAGERVELALVLDGGIAGSVWRGRGDSPSESIPPVSRVRVVPETVATPLVPTGFSVPSSVRLDDVDEDGSFELRGLEPGLHRVELMAGSLVLAVVHDVDVRPGPSTRDPRLLDIDMLQHVARVAYSVVDASGSPIPDASILVYGPGGAASYDSESAAIEAWIPRVELDSILVVAEAPDHAPATCPRPYVDSTITLAPRTDIELRAMTEFERDTGSHGFRMRLRRVDTDTAHARSFAVEIPWSWHGTEPLPLQLPGTGRYELEVMVLQRMGSRLGQSDSDRFEPTEVFIDASGAGDSVFLEDLGDLMRFDGR